MQMVYQDPFGSLNPRWRVAELVEEPLLGYGEGARPRARAGAPSCSTWSGWTRRCTASGARTSCPAGSASGWPSPGRSRCDPALVICDEAVSSLDVLIQAQVLNLFERLRRELGLSYLFISHDLALVKQVSDRVAVMHLGQLAEVGPAEALYRQPAPPLHRRAAGLDPRPRPGAPGAPRRPVAAAGRAALAARPAERLPVPHPLPAGPADAAPRRSPQLVELRARPPGRLPLPADRP